MFKIPVCTAILFNHESPRRGEDFVTRKITKAAARIKLNKQKTLELGNIETFRDWGFAGDYVEAMWSMTQQREGGDYVIGTGQQHSIGEFLDVAFTHVGISDWKKYVLSDPRFKRPAELHSLCGDSTRAKEILGWKPKTSFKELVRTMMEHDLFYFKEKIDPFSNL